MRVIFVSKLLVDTTLMIQAPEVVDADHVDVTDSATLTATGRRAVAEARVR